MKLLQTDQQQDLRQLLQEIRTDQVYDNLPLNIRADLEYWIIELQPKRVRTKKVSPQGVNSLDNSSVQ